MADIQERWTHRIIIRRELSLGDWTKILLVTKNTKFQDLLEHFFKTDNALITNLELKHLGLTRHSTCKFDALNRLFRDKNMMPYAIKRDPEQGSKVMWDEERVRIWPIKYQ